MVSRTLGLVVFSWLFLLGASVGHFVDPAQAAPGGCFPSKGDEQGLFALINDPASTVRALEVYLSTHYPAWDATNEKCQNSVTAAIDLKRSSLFDSLLTHFHLDPNNPMSDALSRESLYSYALGHASPEMLQMLAAQAGPHPLSLQPILEKNYEPVGTTPLMIASAHNTAEMITSLLQAGEQVNARDSQGISAIYRAAASNHNVDAIRALLAAKAEFKGKTPAGLTPLMVAAQGNTAVVVEELIDAGARVEEMDARADTLIFFAARGKTPEVVRLLIKRGVRADAVNVEGKTPLIEAAAQRDNPAAVEVMRELIGHGAGVNSQENGNGLTALMVAAQNGTPEMIKALLNAGADPNITDNRGSNAYQYANQRRDAAVLAALSGN